tara:strand:- start:177611 stop:178555 length:945 start_codon:yes stop_codon:yes gene_type:complete
MFQRIEVVDSHTCGEPTRVVVDGGPDLGDGSLQQQLARFQQSFDDYRKAVVNEPRGSDVVVGALLCRPQDPDCAAGVIFFNNVGFLGMCGHGMIGVVATLQHLGRIDQGVSRIETPVGVVTVTLRDDQSVSIQNVPSYRLAKSVSIDVDGIGAVSGDVAWGGNWFYLVREPMIEMQSTSRKTLLQTASAIRRAINQQGYPDVDHVELFGAPIAPDSDSRNFVLCPGFQYDRSPCGTGTSAKLACLAADGELRPGQTWTQEGILGTVFHGSFEWMDESEGKIVPTINGRAHLVSEATLLLDPSDRFCWGIEADQV